jgi:hypothetical protein
MDYRGPAGRARVGSSPVSAAMKWGLSVLDWRSHAINEHTEHPIGVFKAECGHLLGPSARSVVDGTR